MGSDKGDSKPRGLNDRARGARDRFAARRALGGELVSVAHLIRRPVLDSAGTRIGRLSDVVVRWESAAAHPPVVNILVSAGKGSLAVSARDVAIAQTGVTLTAAQVAVATPLRREGDVALVRDVLDHQLVDLTGVQVVRAADVYLAKIPGGWELAGIDVGGRALLRRTLPMRPRLCPPPARAIDWADLQSFVPRFTGSDAPGDGGPAQAAGTVGSSVRLHGSGRRAPLAVQAGRRPPAG